ncbi:MAG: CPBP family intramembrane glutamic endopeptidase [Brevibacterium aurantiacum]|uniref:CPBP family intramembrane glutamic endopeptidase n=1 Tax=Brevibacterium aurantiacum TaxID=273384 RepID=UPI002650AD98|nr:CPBP family intramembrane metalloprotease [Brevibacterium sp.]
MIGLLPPWVTLSLSLWSIPMIALGATTVVCVWLLPRLRPNLPVIAPVALGLACLGVSVAMSPRFELNSLLTGVSDLSLHFLWQFPSAVFIAVGVGGLSFVLERKLLSLKRSSTEDDGVPPALQGYNVPSREESMQGIAGVASRPLVFFLLTTVTVVGEETLFRGLFLTYAFGQSAAQFALVIVVQAVLYAFTHIAFGPSTVLSKAVLGIGLGVGAYFAGIVVAIIGHSVYQYWVYQQFAPLRYRLRQQGATE